MQGWEINVGEVVLRYNQHMQEHPYRGIVNTKYRYLFRYRF